MHYKQWNELPKQFQNESVKVYYQLLKKRRISIGVKRVLDFVFAFCLTVILSPVMLLLAFCIKVDSRGPVFYRQQ